jgi:MOSC domain-containing protein YiiM
MEPKNSRIYISLGIVILALYSVGGFNSHVPRISELGIISKDTNMFSFHHSDGKQNPNRSKRTQLQLSWLRETFQSLGLDFLVEKLKFEPNVPIRQSDSSDEIKTGKVIRVATKGYDPLTSTPSSKQYTTRKESQTEIIVKMDGVGGDYNHYRATALSSTPDRAISILTTDILKMLKENGYVSVRDGDLGENVYIDGIDYTFFEVGKRYKFYTDDRTNDKAGAIQDSLDGVVVEITERIEPCGNLCRLPYINDESLEPKQRFENCKSFLLWLDEKEGLRGWYGKILTEGKIALGDSVAPLTIGAAEAIVVV